MSKWISVKERLPDAMTKVITCDGTHNIVDVNVYDGHGFRVQQGETMGWIYDECVTHWMPLPKSPCKRCANCGKLFVPYMRSDQMYCKNPAPQNPDVSCIEYARNAAKIGRAKKKGEQSEWSSNCLPTPRTQSS